jgi:hypothetical protein
MKDAGGDGSEVLLLGKHRSKRRHKLEIVRVELARYFHTACEEALSRFFSADRTSSASELACDEVASIYVLDSVNGLDGGTAILARTDRARMVSAISD